MSGRTAVSAVAGDGADVGRVRWPAARVDFLRSGAPWRAAGYLLATGLSGLLLCAGLLVSGVVAGVLAVVLVGLPLAAALALAGVPTAAWERRLVRFLDGGRVPDPHLLPERPGLEAWLRLRYREQATWRELGFTLLAAFVLWPIDLAVVGCALTVPGYLIAALPLLLLDGEQVNVLKLAEVHSPALAALLGLAGLLLLPLLAYPLAAVAAARAALARLVLAPGAQEQRIGELVRSRARLVDAFEAERRRIERDLHDGAQQRLVALAMTLGLARLDAPADGPLAARLADAQREAGEVLAELRELINGIHPQVLTDQGLPEACADAADRSPIPVATRFDLPGRLPAPVESAGYFAVTEALANLARHSGASAATVDGRYADGRLTVEVLDDGRGGADPERGTGLTGLADRIAVLDGTLTVSSPPGGPTLVRVEIPCAPIDRGAARR
ncbi:histidine kinase [Kitasatospora xanthocidica]|uniref:sensor histidine kinase n=1 Tax=Kitasatospora xanthocidica TaxID=83382 RepID=UPI001678BB67|nr:sensor domain-containing protein [Kitasatospora xanthocidica]GHF70489.1 histidine kinase [Kitasatospora xanthocidica]